MADPNYLMIGAHPMSTIPTALAAAADTTSGMAPIIEIATYADTDVYECYIRGQESNIVMRRTNDDWINVTQVFKIAQFSKTQRTKILEKESTNMKHEKVQGGYGRFQGTWVPIEAARFMTEKYKIDNPVVNTILTFQLDPNNPPPKRHKNSVLRKTSPGTKITSPSSYKKTPKKPNANSASKLSTSYTKRGKKNATQPNPSPLQNMVFRTPQQSHLSSVPTSEFDMNHLGDTDATINASYSAISQMKNNETPMAHGYSATQKPLQFYPVPTNVSSQNDKNQNKRGFTSFVPFVPEGQDPHQHMNNKSNVPSITVNDMSKAQKTVRKRAKGKKAKDLNEVEFLDNIPEDDREHMHGKGNFVHEPVKRQYRKRKVKSDESSTPYKIAKDQNAMQQRHGYQMVNENFNYNTSNMGEQYGFNDNNSLQYNMSIEEEEDDFAQIEKYKEMLLKVLSSEENAMRPGYSLPSGLYHPPANLNINFQIDDQGHTPLHWTAAMANIPLVKLLIGLNANALQCNAQGFNCITKAVFYNNCYKNGAFPELISLLKICLITPDKNGRLPLHYLVELSVNKTKDPKVILTYLDEIVQSLAQGDENLLRMCLNYQDNMGNTPLHLAALNLNLQLCNKLCQLGASMTISNFNNETPALILTRFNLVPPTSSTSLPTAPSSGVSDSKGKYYFDGENQEPMNLVNHTLGGPVSVPKTNTEHPYFQSKENNRKRDKKKYEDNGFTSMDTGTPHGRNLHDKNEEYSTPKINNMHDPNLLDTQDTTGLHTIMDDLSQMESLVTSSVIKNSKTSPMKILGDSPISLKKQQLHPTTGTYVSSNLKNPIPIMDIMASPSGAMFNDENNASPEQSKYDVCDVANRIGITASTLVDGLKSQFLKYQNEIEASEKALEEIEEHLESTTKQKQALIHNLKESDGVESHAELSQSTEHLRNVVQQTNEMFTQGMENSQALRLAMLIQREESNVDSDRPNGVEDIEASLNYAIELSVLQFKRRLMMHKIRDERCRSTSSTKINKYKRLIGLNVTDIDSKLDEIERELTAKV